MEISPFVNSNILSENNYRSMENDCIKLRGNNNFSVKVSGKLYIIKSGFHKTDSSLFLNLNACIFSFLRAEPNTTVRYRKTAGIKYSIYRC